MSEFSKDELNAPTWIDKSFFERALRSYEHDPTIEVQKFIITPGTKPGEHFASVMFKIDVSYSSKKYRFDNKNIKLIMKTYPTDDGFKKMILGDSPAFKNEIRMYTRVLPEMERVLANAGDHTKFAPPLVYESLDKEPLPVIVFVDISDQGFKIFDDFGIKNLEIIDVIVTKLAKFHATSLYLQETGSCLDEFESHIFKDELLKKEGGMMQEMFRQGVDFLVSQIKGWGPEWEAFHEKMNGKTNDLLKKVLEVYNRDTPYKVLCHGDFHSKNLLQRNGCLKDEDLILIDHQFPFWTSPAIDLYYVFNILAHQDLTEVHRDDIVYTYYHEFISTLKTIGYRGKVLSLVDLHIELIECAHIEFLQNISFVPPRFMDFSKIDFDAMFKDPNAGAAMQKLTLTSYENQEYRALLKANLSRHLYQGTIVY